MTGAKTAGTSAIRGSHNRDRLRCRHRDADWTDADILVRAAGVAAHAAMLRARTLTNLYNESPAWLAAAHKKLDEAVFVAYGWPASLSDDDLLAKLLELNLSRAATAPAEAE